MNAGVPTVWPLVPSGTIAPKSMSLALPASVQRMLRGLMSRWIKRRECKSASEEQIS